MTTGAAVCESAVVYPQHTLKGTLNCCSWLGGIWVCNEFYNHNQSKISLCLLILDFSHFWKN